MAFTAQEETVLKILAEAFPEAGYTTKAEVVQALTRQRLEQELATLRGDDRVADEEQRVDTVQYNEDKAALQEAINDKQAEIDAL